jgi:hypothetical protein
VERPSADLVARFAKQVEIERINESTDQPIG